jgi:hypothetical protein
VTYLLPGDYGIFVEEFKKHNLEYQERMRAAGALPLAAAAAGGGGAAAAAAAAAASAAAAAAASAAAAAVTPSAAAAAGAPSEGAGGALLLPDGSVRPDSVVWIMKPIGKAQGKGIFLFSRLSQIAQWKSDYRWRPDNPTVEAYVVQRYVDNPFLVGGKKFDMRIYAMVTAYAPLTVYLYRAGFCRFSASRFSLTPESIEDTYVHLTNIAIQKQADNYNPETGCKWELHELKQHVIARFGVETANRLFTDIQHIIVHALLSVQRVMLNDKHCFELYGYDIMINDDLKPVLLEVNASPSVRASPRRRRAPGRAHPAAASPPRAAHGEHA